MYRTARVISNVKRIAYKNLASRILIAFTKVSPVFRQSSSVSRAGFDDYEKERESWNIQIPEKFNFASDILDAWAQKERANERSTSIPAFWFVFENGEELKWSFQDLQEETKKTANMLENQCGIKRGDNVMVILPKIPEFWLVNIAALRIGIVLSAASMQLTAKDLAYRFTAFKPSCIIADETKVEMVEEAAKFCTTLKTKIIVSASSNRTRKGWMDFHELLKKASDCHDCADTSSDESMMIFFTSGTTGHPKMVEHSHSSYGLALADTGRYMLDLTSDCILWNISDTGWAKTAYSNLFAPWSLGSCVFVHQMPKYSPTLTLQVLSKFPIDTLCAPPLAYRTMVQENMKECKFRKLSHCVSAGEALNPEVATRWLSATGLNVYEGYGQTETVLLIGMYKCLKYKLGSIGKPAPGMDIAILDENENELGPGQEGEIALRRNQNRKIFGLFTGYKNKPELTKQRLTNKYFHTGDMAYYDDDGYYWFVGRNDDVINSAGYRIGPFEVESALMEHPAVAEAAVTSSPDPDRGEVVKAFIVLNQDYCKKSESELIQELQDHAKRITAPYKYPRKIEFLKELPKTISGKVKRSELKRKEWTT